MILLSLFAFLAGVVTVLSPCILPILPIVLSGSIGNSRSRPYGVVLGFVSSFTFFTLFLASIVNVFDVSADAIRNISVFILIIFGLSILLPPFQNITEKMFSKLSRVVPNSSNHTGFWGGMVIGLSLGLVWTPCVGPILASVITLAASAQINTEIFFITISYSIGTAIPMFAIIIGGRNLLRRVPWLLRNTQKIQKVFGIIIVLTAIGIYFGFERKFQSYILDAFPGYGEGLTQFEDNPAVRDQLKRFR